MENKANPLTVIEGKGQQVVINDHDAEALCVLHLFESAAARVEGNRELADWHDAESWRYKRYYTPTKLHLVNT